MTNDECSNDETTHATPSDQRFVCPGCGEEIDVPAESWGQLVACPYCNAQFFASHDVANQEVVDDTPLPDTQTEDARQDELNATKIRQLTALRRGAIRARSWCLITIVVCVVGSIQLLIKTGEFVWHEHRWGIRPSLFVIAVAFLLGVARFFLGRAREFKREIDKPALEDPTQPPDFSTLSDGSQHWKNLEELR
jgi:hypothetical protein